MVEGTGIENQQRRNSFVSSNLTASAFYLDPISVGRISICVVVGTTFCSTTFGAGGVFIIVGGMGVGIGGGV